jgi:hypothetical protein
MTTQVRNQSIGEFALRGFTLKHPDDHVVELYHRGELVVRFSQTGATPESLQRCKALGRKALSASLKNSACRPLRG